MSCKAVDHCADGEKIAMQPTPTSNRKCTPCPAGFETPTYYICFYMPSILVLILDKSSQKYKARIPRS